MYGSRSIYIPRYRHSVYYTHIKHPKTIVLKDFNFLFLIIKLEFLSNFSLGNGQKLIESKSPKLESYTL